MDTSKENLIVRLTTDFAVKIIEFQVRIKKAGVAPMASQLFRAGTSIGANVREAQNAESKNDFVHKMKVAAKEADEVEYWIELCKETPMLPDPGSLAGDIIVIHKVLTKIIATSKLNSSKFRSSTN